MEVNKQNENIAIYPSALRAFSYIVFGLILLITGISFISTDKQTIYIIITFILGIISAVYGILHLALRKHPVVLFDKFGFLYLAFIFVPPYSAVLAESTVVLVPSKVVTVLLTMM